MMYHGLIFSPDSWNSYGLDNLCTCPNYLVDYHLDSSLLCRRTGYDGRALHSEMLWLQLLQAGSYLLPGILWLRLRFGNTPSSVSHNCRIRTALLAWLAVYRAAFDTSWLGALGIVVVAWLVLVILDAILIATVGVSIPKFYPF